MSELVQRYTASVAFDQRLWRADIAGSARARRRCWPTQASSRRADLAAIQARPGDDRRRDRARHVRMEASTSRTCTSTSRRAWSQLAGDAGKRLHTGRSRNDQVATDVRLWLRDEIDRHRAAAGRAAARAGRARRRSTSRPSCPASPTCRWRSRCRFAHHLLAYVEMFAPRRRAHGRGAHAHQPPAARRRRARRHQLPARPRDGGQGAGHAEGLPQNSIDAVSDRDFAIEFTAAASLCMVHVSRFSEELVLWMSQNFGFVELADRFCTGSSIMPQKKNPDVPELARGKTGRVVGHLMGLLDADEGPAAGLQQGQPGRQGAAVRHRRHAQGHAAHLRRAGAAASRSRPRRWSARRRAATPPRPTWPTTW